MIRFVESDFERLQEYLSTYSLRRDLGSKTREDLIKRAHKHSLAALQIWIAIDALGQSNTLKFNDKPIESNSIQLMQIGEFFSDIISCVFSGIHGLYKPAHMSLRSGIETLVRGLAGISSNEAAETTSVYRLFEIAGQQSFFSGVASSFFNVLHQNYAELCLYAHSATPAHLEKNYAFANFPRHDTTHLRQLVQQLERLVKAALSILVFANQNLYLAVPPRARDLLDEVLPVQVRLFALGDKP